MAGDERKDGVSPMRVSRLKKRRRSHKDGGCALQHLSPAPSKQTRHCTVADGHGSKENLLNGQSVAPARPSLGRMGGDRAVGEGGGGSGACAQQHDKAMRGAPALEGDKEEGKSPSKGHAHLCTDIDDEYAASALACIDGMEVSSLMAAIPSMLGLDMQRYDASSARFRRELERAFERKDGTEFTRHEAHYDRHARNGVYYPLVGRIDPPSDCNAISCGAEMHSIAFPRCRSAIPDGATTDDCKDIFRHLNLKRKTGHGVILPESWYRFPCNATKLSPSLSSKGPDHPTQKNDTEQSSEDLLQTRVDRQSSGSVVGDNFAKAKSPPLPMKSPPRERMLEHGNVNRQSAEPTKEGTSHASKPPPPPPVSSHKGKLQIQSDKGATIREVFDIDISDYVIGKLHPGDKRYFLEKRTLPPPPIALDDSDEESEDECVAVVRYKIVLQPEDYAASGKYAEDASGQRVGWISDRGRLADEPYLILREV